MIQSLRHSTSAALNLTLAAIVLCGLVIGCVAPGDSGQDVSKSNSTNPSDKLLEKWNYSESTDEMGRGEVQIAFVRSSNTISLDSPYQGDQHATLSLRKHPKYGNDVYISIDKGQLLDSDYNEKTEVRFISASVISSSFT